MCSRNREERKPSPSFLAWKFYLGSSWTRNTTKHLLEARRHPKIISPRRKMVHCLCREENGKGWPVRQMAQWVNVFALKPEGPCSTLRIHMVEREKPTPTSYPLTSTHMLWYRHTHSRIHMWFGVFFFFYLFYFCLGAFVLLFCFCFCFALSL